MIKVGAWLLTLCSLGLALPAKAAPPGLKCEAAVVDAEKPLSAAAKKRLALAETGYYRLGPGEIITLQVVKPANAGKKTLLLGPGIFRAMTALTLAEEPRVQQLVQEGFGVALLTLSTQPYSLMELSEDESPAQKDQVSDYVHEMNVAVEILQKEYNLKDVIPVSLSFSSVLTVNLQGFPMIIETVPMTSTAADKPELAKALQNLTTLQTMNAFNPWFDPNNTRNTLDKAYREKWQSYVAEDPTGHIRNHAPSAMQKENIVKGYMAMTKAIETFKWPRAVDLPTATRRVFVLARNETPTLLKDQVAVIRDVFRNRSKTLMIMVEESGHVLPKEQPGAYARALSLATSDEMKDFTGVVVITPSTGEIKRYTGTQVEDYLRTLEQ